MVVARGRPLAVKVGMAEQEQRHANLPWLMVIIYLGFAAVVFYTGFNSETGAAKHVSYSEFLAAVQDSKLQTVLVTRSEERRVGKECRSGWSRSHYKKQVE